MILTLSIETNELGSSTMNLAWLNIIHKVFIVVSSSSVGTTKFRHVTLIYNILFKIQTNLLHKLLKESF